MFKSQFITTFGFIFFLTSCNFSTSPKPDQQIDSSSSGLPNADESDLLELLEGRWVSETDSTYILEFVGGTLRHIKQNAVAFESEIDIDSNCTHSSCTKGNSEGEMPDGWCFIERNGRDTICHIVAECDSNNLQFRTFGVSGSDLSFKRF